MLLDLFQGHFSSPREFIQALVVGLIAVTLAFAIHEFFHAFVAYLLGDTTARDQGRLTLNPIAHIDPVGSLCILLVGFGWGKPVPYNPSRLRRFGNRRFMSILVILAGVFGNLVLGIISAAVVGLIYRFNFLGTPIVRMIVDILLNTTLYCAYLGAFNLLPIPPLDGFNFVQEIIPMKLRYSPKWRQIQLYASRALFFIILIGSLTGVHILSGAINFLAGPALSLFSNIFSIVAGLR